MRIGEAAAARLVALTDPSDAAAQNNLGVVLQGGGRAADAERAFGRALALDGGMTVARRNLRALPSDVAAAASDARWARVRADATEDDAWRALVRHHTARGEFDAADAVLARWEQAAAGRAAPAAERARWALDAGDPDAALAAVARARAGRDASPLVLASMDLVEGRAAYQRGDIARALAAVDRARAAAPDDAEVELLRSFVLGELGAAAAAAASRARAAQLDPALAHLDPGMAAPTDAPAAHDLRGPAFPSGAGRDESRDRAVRALALAGALRQKAYFADAAGALGPALACEDARLRAAARGALGVVHLLQGAPLDAVPCLREALDAGEVSGRELGPHALALAAAQLLAGDLDAADASARGAASDCAGALLRAGADNVRALTAWRRGDLSRARAHLLDAAAAARRLDAVGAHGVRAALAANLALLLGAAGGAVAAGAAAVRLAPGDPAGHVAHARALSQAGDHAGARDAFARACVLAPEDAAARYGLAFAAGACGDRATARAELARAVALSAVVRGPAPRLILDADGPVLLPGDGTPFVARATPAADDPSRSAAGAERGSYAHVDARLAAGDYDRALAAAESALARGAPAAAGLVRAGHALARSGRATLALERYERAAAADPSDPALATHVVRALHGLGRYEEACGRASKALARWPAEPGLAALLARAAADRGATDLATEALARCARTPGHAAAGVDAAADGAAFWADVACAWQALGAWEAAAAAWGEASRVVPALASPALARARALARAGHAAAADALLEELAQTAPGLADVWRARADLAMAAGQLPAARAHLARVVEHDAGDADALAALAAACGDAGRAAEALSAAERALAIDPEHPLALAAKGDCASAAGDVPAADDYWRRALAVAPVGAGATRARCGLRGLRPSDRDAAPAPEAVAVAGR